MASGLPSTYARKMPIVRDEVTAVPRNGPSIRTPALARPNSGTIR